jgi:benzoyl-CoA reductase/2-hydroxyglutaryl-CoA dehydratase subunit BcrC/BadD/HgdB
MTNKDPWGPFYEISQNPWPKLKQIKAETGKKVIGHILPDVPEELIHAAGAIPVAVAGAGVSINLAQTQIPSYSCSHAMGALELQLTGAMDVLDGMVIPYVCDTTRNLYHLWRRFFPDVPCEFLRLPKKIGDPNAGIYLREEFLRLSTWLNQVTEQEISQTSLAESISLYERSRKQLKSAYMKMKTSPTSWRASRVIPLFESALRTPREEHLNLMSLLPWDCAKESPSSGPFVYVRGKVWDPPEIAVLFDELGLTLVGDEIVTGFRSVAAETLVGDDGFKSLADRHMSLVPYTGYHVNPIKLIEDFIARIRQCGAQGVIFLNPKFCEAAAFDTPDFVNALKKNDIPNLVLETSSGGASLGQIRLRLEAFREILAGDFPE